MEGGGKNRIGMNRKIHFVSSAWLWKLRPWRQLIST